MATPIDLSEDGMDATAPDLCDRGTEAIDIGDLLVRAGDRLGDCYADGLPKTPVIRATLTDTARWSAPGASKCGVSDDSHKRSQ
jgi:hypothetical protein